MVWRCKLTCLNCDQYILTWLQQLNPLVWCSRIKSTMSELWSIYFDMAPAAQPHGMVPIQESKVRFHVWINRAGHLAARFVLTRHRIIDAKATKTARDAVSGIYKKWAPQPLKMSGILLVTPYHISSLSSLFYRLSSPLFITPPPLVTLLPLKPGWGRVRLDAIRGRGWPLGGEGWV